MLIPSLRRLALATAMTALYACEESAPSPEPPLHTPVDAEADAVAYDAGAMTDDAALAPNETIPDAAHSDDRADAGADAGADDDAQAADATTPPPDAMTTNDGGVPSVTPCTDEVCCLPFVSKDDDPSNVCQEEVCLAQQQTFYVGGDGETRVENSCALSPQYSRLFSYHKNGGPGSVELFAHGAGCQDEDAAALRAGIWKVQAHGEAFDARTFEWTAVSLVGPSSVIKELDIEDGHLRMVIEGALTKAITIGAITAGCAHGEIIPLGLCNCRYQGAGPKATFIVDLVIRP